MDDPVDHAVEDVVFVGDVVVERHAFDPEDPADAATAWLAANPDAYMGWVDGVTTEDGGGAVEAVKASLGM